MDDRGLAPVGREGAGEVGGDDGVEAVRHAADENVVAGGEALGGGFEGLHGVRLEAETEKLRMRAKRSGPSRSIEARRLVVRGVM